MEELLGALLDFLIEFIVEILFEGCSAILGRLFANVDNNKLVKKRIKFAISFTFFGLSILVLVLSLIFKQGLLAIVVIIYLLILVLYHMFKFINSNIWKNNIFNICLSWIKRITKYAFLIALIYFGNKNLANEDARIWLNILSIIFILIYFAIDMYKLSNYKKEYNYKKFQKTNETSLSFKYYDDEENKRL